MRHNVWFFLLMLLAAGVFFVFVCPYLRGIGRTWVCVFFYAVFVLIFIYGRAGIKPKRR